MIADINFERMIFECLRRLQCKNENRINRINRIERMMCDERTRIGCYSYYLVVMIGFVLALDFDIVDRVPVIVSSIGATVGFRDDYDDSIGETQAMMRRRRKMLLMFITHVVLGLYTHTIVRFANAGDVTERNHRVCMKMFHFDGLMYEENRECRTMKLEIPARSKFDRVTQKRVCKFDHYCGVCDNAIGMMNLRWFLLFLITNASLCFHGFIFSWNETLEKLPRRWLKEDWPLFLRLLVYYHTRRVVSQFVLLCVGIAVIGFATYHFYLAARNVTTNESYKYAHMKRINKSLPKSERIEVINIYNKGIVANFKEVAFPPKLV